MLGASGTSACSHPIGVSAIQVVWLCHVQANTLRI